MKQFLAWLKRLIQAWLKQLKKKKKAGRITFDGWKEKKMYIVKNDQPDVTFEIEPPEITDAEGEVLPPADMVFNTSSSDPAVLEIQIPDPLDTLHGNVHFGKSGNAAVTVNVLNKASGVLLGSFGSQFTVTTGDPASIVGGKITFAGLTEV